MLSQALIVAEKELKDALRDERSLLSTIAYCLMGPAILFLVSLALVGKQPSGSSAAVLIGMVSVFILASAFIGGMNLAIDTLAGERERKSLLPLLMNSVDRRQIVIGKWIATSCFSLLALLIDLAAFAFVLSRAHVPLDNSMTFWLIMGGCGLLPLALFAAALELGISTACRSTKEAINYLSMLLFAPMGLGFLSVFFPSLAGGWAHIIPVFGQQWQIQKWTTGGHLPLLPAILLAAVTLLLTVLTLCLSIDLLKRDDVVYGN